MPTKEKKDLEKSLRKKIREFSALYEVGKSITSTLHLDQVLKIITRNVAKIMNASSCSLRLLNHNSHELVLKCSYGPLKDKAGESIAGRVVKEGKPYIIRSLITVPLVQKNNTIGALSIYNRDISDYKEEDVRLLSMFASQAAIAIENARLYEQAQDSYTNTIKILSNIIDAKDSHTFGHSERVMEHSLEIADELKFSGHEKNILKYASLLHDIGKIGIDVGILRKPSKLNEDEWKIMVMHPVLGSGIVEQIGFLSDLVPIILRHHERYDGKGYPGKFKKEEIPLGARILAVTDAYESMVSDRPYRKALSFKKARQELLDGASKQFDPKIVKAFLKILERDKRNKKRR